jgi:dipeptidase E
MIVPIGGFTREPGPLGDYVLGLAERERPRLLYVPTASFEDPSSTLATYALFRGKAEVTHLHFSPWPPAELRKLALEQDVILVGGGNTANMLAVWRAHGFHEVLREAWERGVVLAGWSAGAICWFEAGLTDSFGPQLEGMHDGLGFLPGSACPHYGGEELRRPRYRELVREGFPAGIAIDDDVGVRFDGTELAEVVTTRAGATAYRVSGEGEQELDARLIR